MAANDPTSEHGSVPAGRGGAPVWARVFVALFLAAFVACAAFVVEAWPLSGFRLFSHLRHAHLLGWQATTVSSTGRESAIRFAEFPRTYRHLTLIMQTYGKLSPRRQDAVCQAWATFIRRDGGDVAGVRIYRTVVDLHRHRGHRQRPPAVRHLRFTCADGRGARAVRA